MRIYYGGYGHHPSGKQYAYWGNDNYRTGQNVVAPVTNKFTGQTYNTMFTIMRTSNANSQMASNEAQRLSQRGIGMKMIKGTNTLELPGAIGRESQRAWKQESDAMYEQRMRARLISMEI